MEKNFLPQLCGVELQNNKVEAAEPVVITTRWKNIGEGSADFKGEIVVDIDFFNYQRLEENQQTTHNVKWTPYPAMYQWRTGEIVATTGIWRNKTGTWGGSYKLTVSIVDDNGERINFIGKDGKLVSHDFVTIIDVGWGLGRKRLWATDRHKNISYVEDFTADRPKNIETVELDGYWRYDRNSAVPVGCGIWEYDSEPIEIHTRNIDENANYFLHNNEQIKTKLLNADKHEVRYGISVFCGSFEIVYSGNSEVLEVKIENVKVDSGFEIISIYIPTLVSAGGKSNMIDLFFGGRLVDVQTTVPMGLRHIFDADELGSLYDDEQQIVVDTTDLNTVLHQSINEINGIKTGVIGIQLYIMQPAEKPGLKSILLPKPSDCRIQKAKPGWNEAVKILRKKYHSNGTHVYDRSIIYKILVDWGPKNEEDTKRLNARTMTIAEMDKLVSDVYRALDGVPQIVYVGGWQLEGHDTGYPNVDKHPVNPRMGTEEEFVKFLASGDKYNASISLHDNFEDVYLEPDANLDNVGTDRFGDPYKCWIWCGGQGYTQCPKKFVESGRARERITNIVKRFGIKKTYHLDGLTSEILRQDYDPNNQSSFNENNEYKKEIVKIWNEFGIDISSESLTSPLVGTIGHAWSTRDRYKATYYPGEKPIPLVAMACHGVIHYNMIASSDYLDRERLMWCISYGGNIGWGDTITLETSHINGYYIQGLPMGLIEDEYMEKCEITDDVFKVDYTNNCHVYCDKKKLSYEVVKNGRVIAKDFTTFAPGFKPETYLAYSDHDCTVVYDAPEGWEKASGVEFLNGDKSIPVKIDQGKITLTLTAYQPQRIVKS